MSHYHLFMTYRSLAAIAGLLLFAPDVQAQTDAAPVALRYHFTPGQRLRYLIQRDPYFDDPAAAIETTDPRAPYRPPVVERLTEEVLAVGRDGTATVRVTVGPEPGFEEEGRPQPPVTRTVRVTPQGWVLTPPPDRAAPDLLRAFFRLPAAPERGESQGQADLTLLTQALPPTVAQSRSPDHDGTLLQTTRSAQADRVVFDVGAGSLRRQVSTLTVGLSLTMTGRGARGAADFGHVIPNVQVVQTMTIDRQDDPPALPRPAASSPSFKWATVKKLTMTSRDQELIFARWTGCQTPCWFGYCHAPKKVAMFSATHRKKPISPKATGIGRA